MRRLFLSLATVTVLWSQSGTQSGTITLQDAIARAQRYSGQIDAARIVAALAHEDRTQARAASLPSVSALNQFIYTEGNSTPSGVFVANDGVHVYNEQAQVHQELLALVRHGEIRAAAAAEAIAQAKADIAMRGLKVTVTQNYYAIAAAEEKLTNSERSVREAQDFLNITSRQEKGGEAAHADVIKAQLQLNQRLRDEEDAALAVRKAKLALAVMIFPAVTFDFEVVDDLAELKTLPQQPEFLAKARADSPDMRVAQAGVREARASESVAKYAYLPSFSVDFFYGIDANQFAAQTDYPVAGANRSNLPNYLLPNRQNLGYSGQATLIVPVWNWGSIRSKVKQAELKAEQAQIDLTVAEKQLQSNIASAYEEAEAAQKQIQSLRDSSALAAESLRLTVLRYEAGEAVTLEVTDAQTALSQARGAEVDGLVRYRVALANLSSLTGTF